MEKFATMKEIADALGLSRSTVSYILNDQWRPRHISEKTARKVMDFISEVNFTPSLFGRALKGKIHTDAAILIPKNLYAHHQQTFFTLLDTFAKRGFNYLVLPLHSLSENMETMRKLRSFRVSKVIIFATMMDRSELCWWQKIMVGEPEMKWFLYDYRMELRLNGSYFPDNTCAVGFDRTEAFNMLIAHVASRGYRRLYYRSPFYTGDELSESAGKNGLELIGVAVDTAEKFADAVMPELAGKRKTALFFPDDLGCIQLIKILISRHLQIPGDAGVISWDGLDFSANFIRDLETLAIPHDEMLHAAERFLSDAPGPRFLHVAPSIRQGETLPVLP